MKRQSINFSGSLKLAGLTYKPDTALTKYIHNILEAMQGRFHARDHQHILLSIKASRKPTWLGRPESGKFKVYITRIDRPEKEVIVDDKFYSDEL